jgi:hypothetical protein
MSANTRQQHAQAMTSSPHGVRPRRSPPTSRKSGRGFDRPQQASSGSSHFKVAKAANIAELSASARRSSGFSFATPVTMTAAHTC